MNNSAVIFLLFCGTCSGFAPSSAWQIINLDGNWDIADSKSATGLPSSYSHKAPVPGLAHSATPAFPDVDRFDSREVITNRVGRGEMPADALEKMQTPAGTPHQNRNYFWYRTSFSGRWCINRDKDKPGLLLALFTGHIASWASRVESSD